MLKNAYLLAKIGADTAKNERHLAKNLPKNWQLPHPSALKLLPEGGAMRRPDRTDWSASAKGGSRPNRQVVSPSYTGP